MKKISSRKQLIYPVIIVLMLALAGLVTATPAPQQTQSGAPSMVSYQGQVTQGGTPFSGTGYFKFAIIDSAGTTSYWSNDGTSTVGSEPTAGVALSVNTGLFNVLLGDTTLAGMTQGLSAGVFDGTDRTLRVWFSSDGSTYQLLSPDQRIAAVPYALQAENAKDADTLDGNDSSAYQLQVSGSCSVGSTIQSINPDGSVACEAHDTRLGFSLSPVYPSSLSGDYNSITIGIDGLPIISTHYAQTLKVVHCGNAMCTSENTLNTVDSTLFVGQYSSITIGADGLPVISHYAYSDSDLKVAHCGDAACSTGNTTTTVDSGGDVGQYTSITIGTDGLPVISYYDSTNRSLKIAHCGDATCSTGNTLTTVDSTGNAGQFTSISIGGDGLPVISYYGSNALKVAHCGNATCSAGNTINTVDATAMVGIYSDIALGSDGLPVISYYDTTNDDLKVAHCGDVTCSSGNILTAVDMIGNVGLFTSITIGADGFPVISYKDNTNLDLKVAHCGNHSCSVNNTLTAVDSDGHVGIYTAITIGVDGLPVICYKAAGLNDLKVAHCSNVFCIPYWRRR